MPPPLKMASGSLEDITMAGVGGGGGGGDGGAVGSAWAEEEDVVESPPV